METIKKQTVKRLFDKNAKYIIGNRTRITPDGKPFFSQSDHKITISGENLIGSGAGQKNCKSFDEYLIKNPDNLNPRATFFCYSITGDNKFEYFDEGTPNNNGLGDEPEPVKEPEPPKPETPITAEIFKTMLDNQAQNFENQLQFIKEQNDRIIESKDKDIQDLKALIKQGPELEKETESYARELYADTKSDLDETRKQLETERAGFQTVLQEKNKEILDLQKELAALKTDYDNFKISVDQTREFETKLNGLQDEIREASHKRGLGDLMDTVKPFVASEKGQMAILEGITLLTQWGKKRMGIAPAPAFDPSEFQEPPIDTDPNPAQNPGGNLNDEDEDKM